MPWKRKRDNEIKPDIGIRFYFLLISTTICAVVLLVILMLQLIIAIKSEVQIDPDINPGDNTSAFISSLGLNLTIGTDESELNNNTINKRR